MQKTKSSSMLILCLLGLSTSLSLIGIYLVIMGIMDYNHSTSLVGLLSPDGNLESFTPSLHAAIRIPSIVLGCLLILVSTTMLVFLKHSLQLATTVVKRVSLFLIKLWEDSKDMVYHLTHLGFAWWEWMILLLLLILVIADGWVWIEKPMVHDESYTFIAFARRPLIKVISDYHLPNNHILNSILIHFIYKLVGNPSPVVVRFPSYLAGVFSVILVYVWARKVYGRAVAIPGAALVATLPQLVVQMTNGRGYVIMAALTLVMLGAGEIVRRKKNRAAWVILVLATTLNFYTLPITAYPFIMISVWLLLSGVVGDVSTEYQSFWDFVKYLFAYGLFTGLFTFLLYTPIFMIGTGWNSFFGNSFVSPLAWADFLDTLPIRLNENFIEWTNSIPVWAVAILCVGFLLSIGLHFLKPVIKIPFQVCMIFCLIALFLIQRPNPWARTWTYLIPLILVFCAAGWVQFGQLLFARLSTPIVNLFIPVSLTAIILVMGGIKMLQDIRLQPSLMGEPESITLWLQDQVNEEDIVLISSDFGPSFWYYFDRYGLPMDTVIDFQDRRNWEKAYFIVDNRQNNGYLDLISSSSIVRIEDCSENRVKSVYQLGHYTVYLCTK